MKKRMAKIALALAFLLTPAPGKLPADGKAIIPTELLQDEAITNDKVAPAAAIAGSKISPDVTNAIIGVAAGYKIARGSVSITGTADVTTGLATVVAVVASLGEDPNADAATVTAAIGGVAGHADLKVWKLNEGAPNTFIASGAAKTVNWIAIGT